ncbi:hypothetical protein BRAO285_2950003 [Bradyrhizobium sp. ORS 285]|nr:hypothetical protein BRAO285_2950003 [Bradyrhizobium sp. ORS 285]
MQELSWRCEHARPPKVVAAREPPARDMNVEDLGRFPGPLNP